MDAVVHAHSPVTQSSAGAACDTHAALPRLSPVVLPVLTRSISLLTLLLQDSAIDLELASSVVALDPGLSFGTLQLANAKRAEAGDPVWQLPMAVVEAGREALLQYVQRVPRVELVEQPARRRLLERLAADAVVRAGIAHLLVRELGGCAPRKAFLSALLFELPLLAYSGQPLLCPAEALLPAMCRILPAGFVRVAMVGDCEESVTGEPLIAAVLLAEGLLRARAKARLQAEGDAAEPEQFEDLASVPLWTCWNEAGSDQRNALLHRGWQIAAWAEANLHRLDPWEFIARLESRNLWR